MIINRNAFKLVGGCKKSKKLFQDQYKPEATDLRISQGSVYRYGLSLKNLMVHNKLNCEENDSLIPSAVA